MTHTYAILEISAAAYAEIRAKLLAAGYEDQFHERPDGEVIDMHGVALRAAFDREPWADDGDFGADGYPGPIPGAPGEPDDVPW